MDNKSIFKALSSDTRIEILKILLQEEMHITGLAKKIGISVPVTARHVKILEQAELIKKKIIGNVYLLSANNDGFKKIFEPFIEEEIIEISEKDSLFDALKQLPSIKIEKVGKNQYISEVDGEEGYYLYEVDGKKPNIPIDEYKPNKNITLELDKIIPIHRRKIKVRIKKKQK